MLTVNMLHFMMQFYIAGFIYNWLKIKLAGTFVGAALDYAV